MRRKDWLLTAIGSRIEPIQIQKTLFKFAEEAGARPAEGYSFVPYNWGPCSTQIYGDLEQLREEGLVEFVPTGRGWNAYRLTNTGDQAVDKFREKADPEHLQKLDEIRNWVVRRPFNKLLRDVYADYPQYAERSLFER